MTHEGYVLTCQCPACWCMGAATGSERVCEDCRAGAHEAARERPRPALAQPKKCARHDWTDATIPPSCKRCGHVQDAARVRAGRNSRERGGRHELKVAREYGGTKVGHFGGPVDVRGTMFEIQVKTHVGPPPARALAILHAMDSSAGGRIPVLLDRYLPGPGQRPIDLFTVRGDGWLALHGKDGLE